MRRKRKIRSLEVNYIANNKAVIIVDSSYIPKLSLKPRYQKKSTNEKEMEMERGTQQLI